MTYRGLPVFLLFILSSAAKDQSRWSRQISSYTADISDWVPLPGPVDREPQQIRRQSIAEPRILTEPFPGFTRPTGFSQDGFPPRPVFNTQTNRQLYLQAVPSAPQNYLSDHGFGHAIKFGLNQPNFPLSQGFISPQFNYDSISQIKSKPPNIPIAGKFESFSKTAHQLPPTSQTLKPFTPPSVKLKPEPPKFIDGYRLENYTDIYNPNKKAPSMQKVKFETIQKPKELLTQGKPKVEREEVQLLYVPVESINRGQFNFRSPLTSSQILNTDLYQNQRVNQQTHAAEFPKPIPRPLQTFNSQESLHDFNSQLIALEQGSRFVTNAPTFSPPQATTVKPRKLKPHQPPLAIFLSQEAKKSDEIKVGDVLYSLKSADTVAVLDSVNPANAPKVFIGPSTLIPPERYVKFELPYLSNIENIDKKLRHLPFFVAPLSYHTPQGFAKIPFPSPHVGSVLINSQIKDTTTQSTQQNANEPNPNPYLRPSYNIQPNQHHIVSQKPRITFYSTAAPKTITTPNYKQNYYSVEQQSVRTHRPLQENQGTVTISPRPGSYFLSNNENQFNPPQYVNFPNENSDKSQNVKPYNFVQEIETTTTPRTTVSTTTRPSSTHSSQLLETHNPYSINHAFQFNSPIEYHNFFDDNKQTYAPPSLTFPTTTPISSTAHTDKTNIVEQNVKQRLPPNYVQNYSPEIHYETETQSLRRPNYNANDYTANIKNERLPSTEDNDNKQPSSSYRKPEISNRQPETSYREPQKSNGQPESSHVYKSELQYNQPESYHQLKTMQNLNKPFQKENLQPEKNQQTEHQQQQTPNPSYENEKLNNPPSTIYQSGQTQTAYEHSKISETDKFVKEDGPVEYESAKSSQNYGSSNYVYDDVKSPDITSSTTSTTQSPTTRRANLRTRGRPRYTSTTVKADVSEYTSRATATRRPFRERKPITSRPRYDPNKITSEKVTKDSSENVETTSKSSRTRTRGRIHYKPNGGDDNMYDKRAKKKEQDLAYQRDVLHQNYPVTLMERTSTVDIEAITEATAKQSAPTRLDETTAYDTENAYSNDKLSITEHNIAELTGDNYSSKEVLGMDNRYVQQLPSGQNEEYYYPTKSSGSQSENAFYEEKINLPQSLPDEKNNTDSYAVTPITEQNLQIETQKDDYSSDNQQTTILPESDVEKTTNQRGFEENIHGENVVETTPSYNRVRIRPGLIRPYHQSSAEPSKQKTNRKKLSQPITYRPAFDRRRTTMRIEEIEADLKTKQVHSRPEIDEHKHPVYKPDPSTEPPATASSDTISKRGQLRRRKPVYSTPTTEGNIARRPYDAKNRFRGRRPTDKPTESPETQTEGSTSTTTRSSLYNRYNQRTKLSERFNKKPPQDEPTSEDQELNYSIHRPKYATLESERWSPKISKDTFKPYNPNEIDEEGNIEAKNNLRDEETDIITARNEYNEDILISVTPASNNERANKKIPDIPPTLEAYVEQSKVTKSESSDSVSTFESMLEEVMKSLEEQDEDEYTNKVMKHKGGEIGEIPPEKVISSGENYSLKSTTTSPVEDLTTTEITNEDIVDHAEEEPDRKSRRRGFWKKVKVRPLTESIEVAESQYYPNTVNQLGESVSKGSFDKYNTKSKNKFAVTTYKPRYHFIKDFFETDEAFDITADLDIPKINASQTYNTVTQNNKEETTEAVFSRESLVNDINPGDMDLGTGTPDPTFDNAVFNTEPTQPQIDRSDGFSFMDYLFGVTSHDEVNLNKNETIKVTTDGEKEFESTKVTTENSYIPDEITAETITESFSNTESSKMTEQSLKAESSSISSFMDPTNVISTSMSTEVSHETEICFRGKCIKTNKDLL